jgi:pimeloyl-ACP methyl ester carboxylesterase
MDAVATPKDPRLIAPLAQFGGAKPPAPAWFERSLACEPERLTVPVQGADIETLAWGEVGRPGLLLMHGNGAHAGWWRMIAPFFADSHRVAAFSWSGMGGSGWREAYTLETFSAEVIAVAEATGLFAGVQKPVAVGHSFGSFPLAETAYHHGERFRGIVLVDSPFSTPERREERRRARGQRPRRPNELRPHNVYSTFEAAMARFRLAPLQYCENTFIVDLIAREALKKAPRRDGNGEGWTWKFDPFLWRNFQIRDLTGALAHLRCPAALMRGGLSELMRPEDAAYTLSLMPAGSPYIEIPEAWHHVMIDQPLAFVAALRALIASWNSTAA